MSFSEYDREILKEFRRTLHDIKDLLAENVEINRLGVKRIIEKNNQTAEMTMKALRFQLEMLEESDEEDS